MSKIIALVGGSGFIGHNLAIDLKKSGYEPYVIDSLSVNNLFALERTDLREICQERLALLGKHGIPFVNADARDYDLMSKIMASRNTEVIVHLAAISHLSRANKDPYSTFDHSLRTLENSLDVGLNIGVERLVYFSSSTAYGDFPAETVTEETPLNPRGIYGALKASGELMVKAYQEARGLNYSIVRPSALYGARCVSGRVVQLFVEASLRKTPLIMRGDERLDFTYINDLVSGARLCIEREEALNETFNITAGEGRNLSEVVEILRSMFPDLKVIKEDFDQERPKRGTLSIDKAKNLLGYGPKWPIERGVPEYVNWYKERANASKDQKTATLHGGLLHPQGA